MIRLARHFPRERPIEVERRRSLRPRCNKFIINTQVPCPRRFCSIITNSRFDQFVQDSALGFKLARLEAMRVMGEPIEVRPPERSPDDWGFSPFAISQRMPKGVKPKPLYKLAINVTSAAPDLNDTSPNRCWLQIIFDHHRPEARLPAAQLR